MLGDPEKLGLDAVYPAFFLALLLERAAQPPRAGSWPRVGALIALALVPIAPTGVTVLEDVAAALDRRAGGRRGSCARRRSGSILDDALEHLRVDLRRSRARRCRRRAKRRVDPADASTVLAHGGVERARGR